MVFPYNSKTITGLISGNNSADIVSTTDPKIVLGVGIQQSGVASESLIYCGNDLLAKNYAKDFSQHLIYHECNDVIRIEKTGQDEAFFSVVYYEGTLGVRNETTGAEFFPDKTLSYGEAVMIWFLTLFTLYFIFKKVWDFWWKK